jgi:hypothetical protein
MISHSISLGRCIPVDKPWTLYSGIPAGRRAKSYRLGLVGCLHFSMPWFVGIEVKNSIKRSVNATITRPLKDIVSDFQRSGSPLLLGKGEQMVEHLSYLFL